MKRNIKQSKQPERVVMPSNPAPNIRPLYCGLEVDYTFEDLYPYYNMYVYIWLNDGREFWMYPMFTKNNMLCGYKWSSDDWEKACINISDIKSIF